MAKIFEIIENNLVVTDTETAEVVFDEFAKETSYISKELLNDTINKMKREDITIGEIDVIADIVTWKCSDDPEEEREGGVGGNQGDPNEEEEPPGIGG